MLCCLNPECPQPLNPDHHKFCQQCSTPLVPLLRNRYKVLNVLGKGGFGKTYLAEDTDKLNERCVVKQLIYQAQGTQANKKIVELFMREAQQLQQLKANQQIPDLHGYFEDNHYLYLVQEFVEGQDLLHEFGEQGPFSEAKIRAVLLDILPILQFIHERGVVHRDLKPENIMRRQADGRLVLIDFGVAREVTMTQLSLTGTKVGSPGYSSLEQFNEGKAYPASDFYSLGATCFHLMTGQFPGQLWTMQGYGWVNSWQDHLPAGLSPELTTVMGKMLQVQAQDRYQTATAILEDLQPQPASSAPTTVSTPTRSQPTRSHYRSNRTQPPSPYLPLQTSSPPSSSQIKTKSGKGNFWWRWVRANTIWGILSGGIGLLLSLAGVYLVPILTYIIHVTGLGIAQWIVLRKHTSKARQWTLANCGSLLVGLVGLFTLLGGVSGGLISLLFGGLFGACFGAGVGLVQQRFILGSRIGSWIFISSVGMALATAIIGTYGVTWTYFLPGSGTMNFVAITLASALYAVITARHLEKLLHSHQ